MEISLRDETASIHRLRIQWATIVRAEFSRKMINDWIESTSNLLFDGSLNETCLQT